MPSSSRTFFNFSRITALAGQCQGQGIPPQGYPKLVYYNAGKEVCLSEDEAAAGSVHSGFAVFPGVADPHFQKAFVYFIVLFPGHDADGEPGIGIDEAMPQEIAIKVLHGYDITVGIIPGDGIDFIVIDPRTAGF